MSDRRKILELLQGADSDLKIASGIEKNRKGDVKIIFTDEHGAPLKNAKVRVKQKNHEFRFGGNIFMLDQLETPEKNEQYKNRFAELFNMATLPFYWDTLEPKKGSPRYDKNSVDIYRRPPIDRCMEFCEKNGIEPREHALAYEHFFPKWLKNATNEEVKNAIEKRCAEISERYADRIRTIEVTNEMGWLSGVTKFYDDPEFILWCFKTAEKYFPNNELSINEGTQVWLDCCRSSDKYYAYIEANLLKGARIDAIGMQFHLFIKEEKLYEYCEQIIPPDNLYRHMDLYSGLGKPLQITEVTVPSYSWKAEDEEIQAGIIEKLYSIWFSHPNVEQIIYWNLVDGYAYVDNPDPKRLKESQGNMELGENYYHGGLLRFDMTPKPAYFKIKDLIQNKWHTEGEFVTDENGEINFRGFYGDYCVETDVLGKNVRNTVAVSAKKDNVERITLK